MDPIIDIGSSIFNLVVVILLFVLGRSYSEKKKVEENKKKEMQQFDNKYYRNEKKESQKNYNENKPSIYRSKSSSEPNYKEIDNSLEQKLAEWETELYSESDYEIDAFEKDYFSYDELRDSNGYSGLKTDILKGIIFSEIISKPKCKK